MCPLVMPGAARPSPRRGLRAALGTALRRAVRRGPVAGRPGAGERRFSRVCWTARVAPRARGCRDAGAARPDSPSPAGSLGKEKGGLGAAGGLRQLCRARERREERRSEPGSFPTSPVLADSFVNHNPRKANTGSYNRGRRPQA